MRSTIQKWGNSLALRVPKALAGELGIDQGTPVEISIDDGRLVVSRSATNAKALERLLAKVTPENIHPGVSTGPAVGREAW